MDVKIISLPLERWKEYKEIRLESLKDSPASFEASFEELSEYPDEKWKEAVVQFQKGDEKTKLFAELTVN